MSEVKTKFIGDNRPLVNSMREIKHSAKELSNEINSGLKETMLAAFSIEAIKSMIESTIEWADGITKASERLKITTDNVQGLMIAAKQAGKEFGNVENAITKIDVAASKALGGHGREAAAFKNLGISTDELRNLNKVDLLQRVAQGAGNLSSSQATANLAPLVGLGNVGTIQGMQGNLSHFDEFVGANKASGRIANGEDLEQLAELKEKWEEISDAAKSEFVPVLTTVLDALYNFGRGVKQLVEIFGTALGAFFGSIEKFDIKGLLMSFGESVISGWKSLISNLWKVITGKESIEDAFSNVVDERIKSAGNVIDKTFGEHVTENVGNIVNDKLTEQAQDDAKVKADEEKKKKEFQDKQNALDSTADRTASPGSQAKQLLSNLSSDSFLKVGNLIGTDANYRLERINTDMLKALLQIVENTAPDNSPDNQDSDSSYGG